MCTAYVKKREKEGRMGLMQNRRGMNHKLGITEETNLRVERDENDSTPKNKIQKKCWKVSCERTEIQISSYSLIN